MNALFALNPQQLSVLILLLTLFPTHYEDERTIQGLIQWGLRHNVRWVLFQQPDNSQTLKKLPPFRKASIIKNAWIINGGLNIISYNGLLQHLTLASMLLRKSLKWPNKAIKIPLKSKYTLKSNSMKASCLLQLMCFLHII